MHDPKWMAPGGAKLAIDVRCEKPNRMVIGLDASAAEVALNGGNEWQCVLLKPADFRDAHGVARSDWSGIRELRLYDVDVLEDARRKDVTIRVRVGEPWKGAKPEFRNLRWVATAGAKH